MNFGSRAEDCASLDLTRFDGHLTSPKLRAEVFDDITKARTEKGATARRERRAFTEEFKRKAV